MNGFQNPYLNPYGFGQQFQQPVQIGQQVTKVNGRNGAMAYQMGANCSALLLDESGTIVWLCTTDGAGYKTVTAYDITPHQDTPLPDFSTLENRIKRLEEIVSANTADSSTAKRPAKTDSPAANKANDQLYPHVARPAGSVYPADQNKPSAAAGDAAHQYVREGSHESVYYDG